MICGPEAELSGETVIAGLAAGGWRGGVGDLEPVELEAFWRETLVYARWEIGQYRRWRGQEEPVLADGYDAEGISKPKGEWLGATSRVEKRLVTMLLR